jgi:soluble lytic murein transglycosylase
VAVAQRPSAAPTSAPASRLGRVIADAAREHPMLDDYVVHLRARAAQRAGERNDALAASRELVERHPDSIWVGTETLRIAELTRTTAHPDATAAWLESARHALPPGSSRWARATLLRAEEAYLVSDYPTAFDLARELRRSQPRSLAARRSRRIMERVRRAHPEVVTDPAEDGVAEAEMRQREGDPAGARAAADAALAGGLGPPLRGRAQWTRAQAERAAGDRESAEKTCLLLAADDADPLAPRALNAVAGWRWNADDDAQALRLFAEVARRFPDSAQAPEALYATGRIHQEARRYGDAYTAYVALARRFPSSSLAAEARWRAGWVRYLARDFSAAERTFGALATQTKPPARTAAEYWQARALEHLGRTAAAREHFEHLAERHAFSYYSELAGRRLGRPEPVAAVPASVPAAPFPAELSGPHAERARLLADLGLRRWARREVDALRADGVPRHALLAAYHAVQAPGPALRLAGEADRRSPGPLDPYLYPLAFWDAVLPAAQARALDPFLVLALMRQESAFEPAAVSPADAHGLMQLLPSTARNVTAASGAPAPTRVALHDPRTNVDLGTTLLSQLLEQYRGSAVKALAAYNAGEDAVAKWERRYGERDEDEFVELISYRETRDYVKAVLRNWNAYRRVYSDSASATSTGSPPNAPFDMIAITSPARAVDTK